MSEELVLSKKDLEKKLGGLQGRTAGSLRELVKKADADGALLLLDCSGSMSAVLETGERAIDALRQVVADVRANVLVPAAAFGPISFGADQTPRAVGYVDAVPEPGGSTPLHSAIEFGRAEKKKHLIVISDGGPDNPDAALEQATLFGGRIDAIFVGNEGDSHARTFMEKLARMTGGTGNVGDLKDMKQLTAQIKGLIGDGSPEQKGAIQL